MAVSSKAVVVGGLADVLLSSVLGVPFSMYVMWSRGLIGLPQSEMAPALLSAVHNSPGLFAIQIVIGVGCSVLGGYIAARIARSSVILNGVLASWLCVAIGIYSVASGEESQALAVHLLLIAITPIAYLVGARIYMQSRQAARA